MARHVESTASAMGIASALCREIISAPQGSIRTVPFRLIQSLYVIAQTQQLQQERSRRPPEAPVLRYDVPLLTPGWSVMRRIRKTRSCAAE